MVLLSFGIKSKTRMNQSKKDSHTTAVAPGASFQVCLYHMHALRSISMCISSSSSSRRSSSSFDGPSFSFLPTRVLFLRVPHDCSHIFTAAVRHDTAKYHTYVATPLSDVPDVPAVLTPARKFESHSLVSESTTKLIRLQQ